MSCCRCCYDRAKHTVTRISTFPEVTPRVLMQCFDHYIHMKRCFTYLFLCNYRMHLPNYRAQLCFPWECQMLSNEITLKAIVRE